MRSAILLSLLLGACSAYKPDLGGTPFLCGNSDPACPEGYSCTSGVCIEDGGSDVPPIDGTMGSGDCAAFQDDSSIEPNDTLGNAVIIDPAQDTHPGGLKLAQLAICPKNDKDLYKISIQTNLQNLTATMTFDDGGQALAVSILNSGGSTIATGSPASNVVTATANNLPAGEVFVQVDGTGQQDENSYKLTLAVTGP